MMKCCFPCIAGWMGFGMMCPRLEFLIEGRPIKWLVYLLAACLVGVVNFHAARFVENRMSKT